jgi:osmotically-inducible protein OsmY
MTEHAREEEVTEISDEITHALHKSWFFDPKTITVTDEDGVVTLTGSVTSTHDRRRAAIAAWSHPDVIDVVNEITLA